jgi:hypothetical protein
VVDRALRADPRDPAGKYPDVTLRCALGGEPGRVLRGLIETEEVGAARS